MFKLFKYLKSVWVEIVLTVILLAAQVWLQLQLPNTMADVSVYIGIMSNSIKGSAEYNKAFTDIWIMGGKMLLYCLGTTVAAIMVGYTSARIGTIFGRELRNVVFKKVTSMSLADYDTFGTSSLITRTTNDIQQMQTVVVMGIRIIITAPLTTILALIYASSLDVKLMIVLLISVPIVFVVTGIIGFLIMPLMKRMQAKIDRVTLVLRENLTGVRVIRAFNREADESKRFDEANRDLTVTTIKANRIMSVMMPSITVVMNLTFLAIFLVGFYNFIDKDMLTLSSQISSIMAIAQYSLQIMMSLLMVVMIFIFITRAQVSAGRINAVLATPDEAFVAGGETAENDSTKRGELIFEDVTFKFPDSPLPTLEHISFKAQKGQTTAIIGSTGSGKSTVVNLIPRFYDATAGRILLNGIDIRNISQQELRHRIGFVPQKAVLFTGTVKDNLLYGDPEATDDEIDRALETAQAKHFISKKEKGLAEEVSQGGKNFSGGQKQRLAIARALVRKAEIYIFDDSFSALDFKTDVKVRRALKSYTADSTVIIVGQRVSSIMDADNIVVLDDGHIAGQGTHAELLKSCPVYQEIVRSQLDPEEVENTIALTRKVSLERGE